MNSVTDPEAASPSITLELAYRLESDNYPFRSARYALWNLKRHNWSDDDILDRAPHYHTNLIEAIAEL